MHNFSMLLTQKCLSMGLIDKSYSEWLSYSIEKRATTLLSWFVLCLVGFFGFGWKLTLSFSIFFLLIRKYTNGYHAATYSHCLFLSILMEIIILILLCVVIVCLIVLLMQNKSKEVETSSTDSLILQKNFEYLLKQVQDVQKNQATSKVSLNQMEEYLYRMNMVMTNTKLRGNWGEYQLDMLLSVYCGQNPSIYSMQYTLPNGKIADCAFHLPDTNKVLCIDSKFPMENYMNLQEDMDTYLRPFKMNMKKHIDDVANKYINMDTMPYALLFVPSEAIYQFVCAKCDDLFTYALQKHVMLVSPTTLVAEVMTLLSSTKDFYRTSHMEEIERNILLLQEDANRLVERSIKAEKTLETLATQFHAVSISAQKLSSRMTKMGEDE